MSPELIATWVKEKGDFSSKSSTYSFLDRNKFDHLHACLSMTSGKVRNPKEFTLKYSGGDGSKNSRIEMNFRFHGGRVIRNTRDVLERAYTCDPLAEVFTEMIWKKFMENKSKSKCRS